MDPSLVTRVAALAGLSISPAEVAPVMTDLGRMIEHVRFLRLVPCRMDVRFSPPSVTPEDLRPDTPIPPASCPAITANTPYLQEGFYALPAILE